MEKKPTQALVAELGQLEIALHQKDFLLTWLESDAHLRAVLLAAQILEDLYRQNVSTRVFTSGLAVSNFRDNSTRTRFSFASAATLLGLTPQDLDEGKSQIAHGETVRETANMISFLPEVIGIRDDVFVGEGHEYMKEVAASVEQGFADGVLPQRPSVVNLQCDRDHPTQSMADLLHLAQVFGGLDALRGRRIAMTWAYSPSYGKPLSVPQGIVALMARFGMDVVLAHPEGYDLLPEPLAVAGKFAAASGGRSRRPTPWRRRSGEPTSSTRRAGRPSRSCSGGPSCCGAGRRGSSKRWRRRRWPRTRATRTGSARSGSWARRGAARRSTCTACRRTSAA